MNQMTRKCLDDSVEAGFRTFGCNKLTYQSFFVEDRGHPVYRLKNQATLPCLDDSEKFLRPFGGNELRYQRWQANP
ncbi:hypothetical protein PV646_15695 [Streptomyces sp. ID05-26A]|nr:hypothetical protein [Streptomyces sp. ID05-26A]